MKQQRREESQERAITCVTSHKRTSNRGAVCFVRTLLVFLRSGYKVTSEYHYLVHALNISKLGEMSESEIFGLKLWQHVDSVEI